jgi:(E)-4-hydroxy-3-methylbut-2-enyl-diphosphate synthase
MTPNYVPSFYNATRRKTIEVSIGNAKIGGDNPILVQSMTNTNTRDIDATVKQTLAMAASGCQLVRITAPTAKDGEALGEIVKKLRAAGCDVPISADIHFQPRAAMEAVKWVEKVRINPGNYVDKGIMHIKEWTDAEWEKAEAKVFEKFSPLVLKAKERGVAIRIGTNHGSLSGRMVYRFGDSVEGMVESAIEYLRVCEHHDFHNIVFSMKASNPKVVIEAYRMLAARLDNEHRAYPFHVGVTEAGEGEDGRLKSAVGIGSLLLDGISDTIRVSLTEDPVLEIPVAEELISLCDVSTLKQIPEVKYCVDPYHYQKRDVLESKVNGLEIGPDELVHVGTSFSSIVTAMPEERQLEWVWDTPKDKFIDLPHLSKSNITCFASLEEFDSIDLETKESTNWAYIGSDNWVGVNRYLASKLKLANRKDPITLWFEGKDTVSVRMEVAAKMGSLFCDGIGDMIYVDLGHYASSINLAYDVLQATGLRRTKTEFISCPSCGRTLFDLEEVTAQIKGRTGHLKNVSIAIMGCIVNGPGEMADADFGYVGGAPGKIQLYVGKEMVKTNIPEEEAPDALITLIKEHGKWIEPA